MSRRRWGAGLVAALTLVTLCPVEASAAAGPSASVSVHLTDLAAKTYLSRQPGVSWRRGHAPDGPTITVDSRRRYQEITGFGASFTDSSAWLVGTRLDPAQRDAVMRDLFSSQGIGLSLLRQPMGASDFAVTGNYSYDDMPAGQTDPALEHFSVGHDRAYIIPLLQQARRLNPKLTLMASPWSPPGWMKTSDSMIGGTLRPDAYQPLADYFVKFLQAYAAAGVPVRYITPQNEPLYVPSGYPGMSLSAQQQNDLIKNHLGPAIRERGLHTGILAYDHNWDVIGYPETMYADPATTGFVEGTAWHCYGGDVRAQSVSHNDYPNKPAWHTECSGGTWEGDEQAGFAAGMGLVINSTRDWAKGVVRWNMALDQNNGPTNGGCPTCRGVVTVAPDASGRWSYAKTVDYWALGHASKFVRPGARRIASSSLGAGDVQDVAFVNRDGSTALVAFNSATSAKTFQVQWGDKWFTYRLPAGAAATFTWSGTQHGAASPSELGSVDVPFVNRDGTRAVISYDSGLLAHQAQVRVGDQWLGYSLPAGASLEPPTASAPLPRDAWTVSASTSNPTEPPGRAVDGDAATRWSTGRGMKAGDWFQVDLGANQTFNQVVLDTTGSSGDSPRGYQLFVSDDGTNWGRPIATGQGSPVTKILVPQVTARYLRVVNQGDAGGWWSIHELNVLGPGGPAAGAARTDERGLQRKTAVLPDGTRLLVAYNSGRSVTTFDVRWGDTTYRYRLPAGAAAVFTTRQA
ncbi:glycoside hydrolase family 30 beta sandwich domain-containing protein [Actinoplanes sp. NPDC049548]|uniref:discoidin domain-containing protein n=1 Tax=Actinoplanes sp. NPDC049548 TaxID=3155152 RepID=UPI00341A40E0